MTTTYDTEFRTETIAAPQYDDPDTYTVAEAWASSLLDEMGDDYGSPAAKPPMIATPPAHARSCSPRWRAESSAAPHSAPCCSATRR